MTEYHLDLPLNEDAVKRLRVGDVLYVTGLLCTLRDRGYKMILSGVKKAPFNLNDMGVYHCGPLMKKNKRGEWVPVSAGPTTSSRMSSMMKELIEGYNVKMIIGKGVLDDSVSQVLKKNSAVYSVFTGGAGVLAASMMERVEGVYWLNELGMTEAVWVLRVKEFGPLIVAMDTHGGSIYRERG
jgi:tartrate/fumarate subfamily iron-sulfur-dependent hydro-lyase beta chain